MEPRSLPERLGTERLYTYPLLIGAVAVLAGVAWLALSEGGVAPGGRAVGGDYIAFHAAGRMVWHGQAAAVYDEASLARAILELAPVDNARLPLHYPPPALLIFSVAAPLPYLLGLAVWTLGSLLIIVAGLRALRAGRLAWRWGLVFPGVLLTLFNGQTGGLVLGLMAIGLGGLSRRPWLAGAALGLLVFKPNYLAVTLVALVAGRRWRAVMGAVGSAAVLCATSLAVLGPTPWQAWWSHLGDVQALLAADVLPFHKMPTLFAGLRSLGIPAMLASPLHGVVALVGLAAVVWAWGTRREDQDRSGVLAAATLLITPFAFDYDLALLWIALAAAARRARTTAAWMLVAACWVLPMTLPVLATVHLPVAPLLIAILLSTLLAARPSQA